MTGLDALHLIAAGTLPAPPFTAVLPVRLTFVSPGLVVFEYEPRADHENGLGSVHGGFVTTVLDSAMGCAVQSLLDEGETYATMELKTSFLRPVKPDSGVLRAEGSVLHRGSRSATAEARLTDAEGRLYAHATSTTLLRRAQALAA